MELGWGVADRCGELRLSRLLGRLPTGDVIEQLWWTVLPYMFMHLVFWNGFNQPIIGIVSNSKVHGKL